MSNTYKINTSEIENCIKSLKKMQNGMPVFKKPKQELFRSSGSAVKQLNHMADDLVKMRAGYLELVSRTIQCLQSYKNSVENNDARESSKISK